MSKLNRSPFVARQRAAAAAPTTRRGALARPISEQELAAGAAARGGSPWPARGPAATRAREPLQAEPSSGVESGRSDVRGGRLLAVSGGGAAGTQRRRAGDEPIAQVGAAAAEPLPAAAPALHPVLRDGHLVAHRGIPQARAGEQPAVAVQVRGSIGGRPPRVRPRVLQ